MLMSQAHKATIAIVQPLESAKIITAARLITGLAHISTSDVRPDATVSNSSSSSNCLVSELTYSLLTLKIFPYNATLSAFLSYMPILRVRKLC